MIEELVEVTAVLEPESLPSEPDAELDRIELYLEEFREAIRRKLPPSE